VENSYQRQINDEFVLPTVIVNNGEPVGRITAGDPMIFFNFRPDRAREITRAFIDPKFDGFVRQAGFLKPNFVCMTQYDIDLEAPVAFTPQNLNNTLGEVLSDRGMKQLRIAETEKYAHLTFFFNGGVEEANPGEDRILNPSPKVETYNLQPAMSAVEITERTLAEINRDYYDIILMNYANADMVGHTGVLSAAIESVKVLDECLARVVELVVKKEGVVMLTADHGNAEMMVCSETGCPLTAHTTNKVPFVLVSDQYKGLPLRKNGSLRDIAPTILNLMGIDIPAEMTGTPLINI
jgi:2,3-bisphosphoglycerate-independent phosphoglycerate mutase